MPKPVNEMTDQELWNEQARLRDIAFGGPEYDALYNSVCAEIDHRRKVHEQKLPDRAEEKKKELAEARGNRMTKKGVEFHVKGFDQMSPESKKALETIVDAAYEEMEEEE